MLSTITLEQFFEWQTYFALEPPFEMRAPHQFAQLVSTVINMTPRKSQRAVPAENVRLFFGDDKEAKAAKKPEKSWQQMKSIAVAFAKAYNMGLKKNLKKEEKN